MKNSFLPLLALCCFILFYSCEDSTEKSQLRYLSISGPTMGTTYHITYSDSINRDLQKGIDSLLRQINLEVSTYIDSSIISRFNQTKTDFSLSINSSQGHHFRYNFDYAARVFKSTDGSFDPTVMPLVNYWGFGYTEKKAVTEVDSILIDSLMQAVSFEKIRSEKAGETNKLIKANPGVQLDFSALAKGYAVDEIGRQLAQKGVQSYMVEIGGEVVCKGKNKDHNWWKIGINIPKKGADLQALHTTINIENKALATSGNYRNYYKSGETSYAHTINPKTGFPEKSTLLSVTILAESCILADAYATAFMVMGREKGMQLANNLDELEAYFIYSGKEGELLVAYTPGIEKYLGKQPISPHKH